MSLDSISLPRINVKLPKKIIQLIFTTLTVLRDRPRGGRSAHIITVLMDLQMCSLTGVLSCAGVVKGEAEFHYWCGCDAWSSLISKQWTCKAFIC